MDNTFSAPTPLPKGSRPRRQPETGRFFELDSPRPKPSILVHVGGMHIGAYAGLVFGVWLLVTLAYIAAFELTVALDLSDSTQEAVLASWASWTWVEPALVGAVVWVVAKFCNERYTDKAWRWDKAHSAAWSQDRDRATSEQWNKWEATRPLAQVLSTAEPLDRIRRLVAWYGGTAYLGAVPDTQDLSVVKRNESVIVFGPGQSGKSTGIHIPSIIVAPGAVIVTSTKMDVLDETVIPRTMEGQCWLYDPMGKVKDKRLFPSVVRAYISPVDGSYDWDDAKLVVDGMIGATAMGNVQNGNESHWKETTKALLTPLLFAAAQHRELTIQDVRRWLATKDLTVPLAVIQAVIDDKSHPNHFGAQLAMTRMQERIGDGHADHSSDVFSTAMTVLNAYDSVHGLKNAHRRNFDPAAFVRSSDTLYIVSSEHVQKELAPLIVWLIETIYKANTELEEERPFHATGRPPLLLALDEAANIAPIKDLPLMVSEGQGKGFQCMIQLQSMAQARKVWGPDGAKTLMDAAGIKVCFGGLSDKDTLEAFSALAGDYDRQYVSNTQSWSATVSEGTSESTTTSISTSPGSVTRGSTLGNSWTSGSSRSTSYKKERYLTPADIATLPPRHALVVRRGTWSIVELVGIHHAPWRYIVGALPVPKRPPRTVSERPRNVAPLPSIAELVANLVETAPPPPAKASTRTRDGHSSHVEAANAEAERRAQSDPRRARLRSVDLEDVNDVDDAGL